MGLVILFLSIGRYGSLLLYLLYSFDLYDKIVWAYLGPDLYKKGTVRKFETRSWVVCQGLRGFWRSWLGWR